MRRIKYFVVAVLVTAFSLGFFSQATDVSAASTKQIQTKLTQLGCRPGWIDGDYGPLTTRAVKRFQVANSLWIDGDAGPITQGKLFSGSAKPCVYSGKSLPSNSGTGKRIVVSQSRNWVWLVDSNNQVLADGGMIDNPDKLLKGTYRACGRGYKVLDYTYQYYLYNYTRICSTSGTYLHKGFHQIPVKISTGKRMHEPWRLGTNTRISAGCIRVSNGMSKAIYYFGWSNSGGKKIVVV